MINENKVIHTNIKSLYLVYIQRQGPHSNSHHAFRMVKKFNCFSIQGKVICVLNKHLKQKLISFFLQTIELPYFIIKEMYCMCVQLEGKCFQEGYVVGHHFLIRKIKLVNNNGVHMVV